MASSRVPGGSPGAGSPEPRALARALGTIVGGEARRVLGEAALREDAALAAEGWERRFMADGARAREAAALYASLGYEVRVEAVRPEDLADDCGDCRLVTLLEFATVYTRRPGAPARRPEA